MVYYGLLSLFFLLGSATMDDFSSNIDFNETDISSEEIDRGGLFNTGVSFDRFLFFIGLGIGLPDDTPNWFALIFFLWQTIVTIFSIGFLISSIWDG